MGEREFVNRLTFIQDLEDYLNLLDYRMETNTDESTRYKLLGEKDALLEQIRLKKRTILKKIREVQDDFEELETDDETFTLELNYLNGYINGCKKMLDYRTIHEREDSSIKILGYVKNNVEKDLLYYLFKLIGFNQDSKLSEDHTVFLSQDIDELNTFNDDLTIIRMIFYFKPSKKSLKVRMSKDEKKELRALNKFDQDIEITKIDDLYTDVRLLNSSWYDAHYVYLNSVNTINSVMQDIIDQLII